MRIRLERVKIVVIREASTQESVPQSSGAWKEAALMEFRFYQQNTKRMRMIRYYIRSELTELTYVAHMNIFLGNNYRVAISW